MTATEGAADARDDEPALIGHQLITSGWAATAVFVATAALGWWREGAADTAAQVVAVVLFGLGVALFGFAFLIGVGRSRTEELSVAGLFLLAGAPRPIRAGLLGILAVQTIAAVLFASLRPFTVAAFAILVPMFGLGCAAMWGARHGTFPTRQR